MNETIFKAYDIRGRVPDEFNESAAFEIGRVLGRMFAPRGGSASGGKKGKIIIGRDARLSSSSLYKAFVAGIGITAEKTKIIEAGIMTTPMLYFLVNNMKAAGGVIVTASHNPKEFNGLKAVGPKATPISGKDILWQIKKSKIKI